MFFAICLMLLTSFSTPFASAFNNITTDSKITANQDFIIRVDNDFANGIQPYDREYDSFRVALSVRVSAANTADGQFEVFCYLVNSSAMGVPMVTTKIPSNIGPDGQHYRIAVQAFNQDPNNNTVNNSSEGLMQSSQPFDLEATTGDWAGFELGGDMIGYPAYIPCEEYNCVRRCYQFFYPRNFNSEHSGQGCDMRPTWNCAQNCSGTSFPSWEVTDDGKACLAAQASSSSIDAAMSKSSTSSVSSVFVSTQIFTTTRSISSSTVGSPKSSSGQPPKSTDTSTGAARATAVPSCAPLLRALFDTLSLIGAVILGVSIATWY